MSSKFLDKTGLDTLWAKIKSTFQTLGNLVTAWGSTPSDTKYPSEKLVKTALNGKASSIHTHGNMTNYGVITGSEAIANGDAIVVANASDSNKLAKTTITFDGSTTTTALTPKGTFEAFAKSADITTAIQSLDVSSVGGAGKYISAISETDGKISATDTTMDTTPTAGSTNAVTSGGIKTALDAKVSSIKKNGSTITPSSGVADIGYMPVTEGQSTATVQNLIQSLRVKPGGRMGSAVVSASTVGSTSIPGAWYNYIWIPHQNGSATSDYQNYGTLLLSPMTTDPQLYIVEGSALNGSTPAYRATSIKENHTHYWFKSESPSNLQNVNDYYQCISASTSDFAGLVKLYDVTEFFDGTIVNQSERSVFFGDVSLIRDGGNAGCKYARVCAMIGYASSQVILQSDDDNAYPVLVKEDFERLDVSGTVGAYVISNNVATLDTTKTKARYFVVDCSEYSRVFINAGFYNASGVYGDTVKAYIFANDGGSVLGNSTGPNFDGYVDVPAGATKLYLHTNTSYSQVSVGPTTTAPKYFLAMRYVNGWPAGKIEYFGRFYTRVTASASFKARPLLLTYVQCFQPVGSTSIPTGYVIQKSASYTTHANSANKLATARKLKTNLARTADSTFDGSANQENIPVIGTLPVTNGGTGATTAIGAEYNILNQVADIDTTIDGDRKIALCNQTKSASNGVFRWLKLSNVWTWIKGLLSSESGVNISGSSASCTGNAATATALSAGADRTKLDGIATGAEVNVQSDWNQATSTADDYIKNKPTLGTAAAKDVPASGDASTTQVVMGDDSRLTDARTPTSHNHSASDINSGVLPVDRGGTGNASALVRGSSWKNSTNGDTCYGYHVATTDVSAASNATADLVAVIAIEDWTSNDTINRASSFYGILEIHHRMNGEVAASNEKMFGRIRSFSSARSNENRGYSVIAVRGDSNYKIDWYVARNPNNTTLTMPYNHIGLLLLSSVLQKNATMPIDYSLTKRTSAFTTYLDYWTSTLVPYFTANDNGVGSSARPVYVDSNGQLAKCKQLVQAVNSIDTSNMDPDVLYVM